MTKEEWERAVVSQYLCSESGEKYTRMTFDDPQKVYDWIAKHPDAVLVWSRPEEDN